MASNKDVLQPHLMVGKGDIAEHVLIPGDPKRVELMATHLSNPVRVSENRQFVTVSGRYKDLPVSIVSSGIGVPAMLITVEELLRVGAKVLIRVGTTGGLQPNVEVGDLVVASASVRTDGGTQMYAPLGYPAVASREIVEALSSYCAKAGFRYHEGIVWTSEAYYAESIDIAKRWHDLNVVSVEMETSALFVLSNIKGVKSGAILVCDGNLIYGKKKAEVLRGQQPYEPEVLEGIHRATEAALEALLHINQESRIGSLGQS
ncbi:MAG: nucleoside phosphorylase [Thermoprotei archaeon]